MLALDPKVQISSSAQVNPGIPAATYVVDASTLRNVVLVAGCDYPPAHGMTFVKYCKRRCDQYLNRGAEVRDNPNWRFTIFDVPTGQVLENIFDPASRKREWKVIENYSKVSALNYSLDLQGKLRFNQSTDGVMSITNIYRRICELGTSNPGSLWELDFFSHAGIGGPVLVNSSDPDPSTPGRGAKDLDPRVHKDFIAPTMTAADLAAFKNAFHVEGFIWSWGCDFPKRYHDVIDQVVNAPAFKSGGGTKDDDVFNFHFYNQHTQAQEYFHFDTTFFPLANASGTYPLDFSRTFLQVKDYFDRGRIRTYSQAIATAGGKVCYGALLGTDALPEKGVSLGLLVIPTKVPLYPHSFASYLTFYTKYLNVRLDPEGRGYGKFEP